MTASQFFMVKSAYKYFYSNATGTAFPYCALSAAGALSGCGTTGTSYSSATPIVYGDYLYAGYNNGGTHQIILCSINSGTGVLSGCASTGSGYGGASGAMPPAFYGSSWAYFPGTASSIYKCPLTLGTGVLGACSVAVTISGATGLNVARVNGNYLYVTQGVSGASPFFCAIDPSNGALSNCSTTSSGTNINGIVFVGNYAYLSVWAATSVLVCKVNTDGSLYPCSSSGSNISSAASLATDGTHVFVSNSGANTVTSCNVSSLDGTLSGCSAYASGNASLWFITAY